MFVGAKVFEFKLGSMTNVDLENPFKSCTSCKDWFKFRVPGPDECYHEVDLNSPYLDNYEL